MINMTVTKEGEGDLLEVVMYDHAIEIARITAIDVIVYAAELLESLMSNENLQGGRVLKVKGVLPLPFTTGAKLLERYKVIAVWHPEEAEYKVVVTKDPAFKQGASL